MLKCSLSLHSNESQHGVGWGRKDLRDPEQHLHFQQTRSHQTWRPTPESSPGPSWTAAHASGRVQTPRSRERSSGHGQTHGSQPGYGQTGCRMRKLKTQKTRRRGQRPSRFLISYHHLPIRADQSPHSQHPLPVPLKVYCRLLGWYTTAGGIQHVPKEETIRPTPGEVVPTRRPIPCVVSRLQPHGSPSFKAPSRAASLHSDRDPSEGPQSTSLGAEAHARYTPNVPCCVVLCRNPMA